MKRLRADSITEAVKAAQAAPVQPPSSVPLDKRDMGFFVNVIDEFARTEWTAHQLELAAMLARTMADLEAEQRKMREEGSIMHSERGTPVVSPRKTVIQMHAQSILSFRRSLSLHARAQKGEARDVAKRRSNLKAAEMDDDDSGDLLARPN